MALGIGNYTLEVFIRVMRRGKARDGHYIYPAMPYTNFSRLADDDMRAPYAYFMKGVTPVGQDNAKTDLLWPFSMRWLMAGWNLIYLPDKPFQSDAVQSAEWNRGAYLVQSLGHCSACHTSRSLAGGEKASTEKDGDVFLSGALIDGWYAPPLRNTGNTGSAAEAGLASWSQQDIVDYLKTGRATHTATFGPMAEVVGNSTQYMSRPDLFAIATYLKGVGGEAGAPAASGGAVKGVVPSRG